MLRLVCRSYRYPAAREPAVHDVAVEIRHGEIVGLTGPNEAGKSTLGLLAAGMAPTVVGGAFDGYLEVDGERMTGRPGYEVAQRVGYVFQNPATQISQVSSTVFEEVALGPMNLGLDRAEIVARVEETLGRLAIDDLALRDPRRLSGGEAQLVAIASLLAMHPAHLVLDEPTAQLDPAGTRLVGAALHALAATGTALLVIEHKLDLLDGLCERLLLMDHGTVVRDGPAETVFADRLLEALTILPPSRIRIARAARAAGVRFDEAAVVAALRPGPGGLDAEAGR